MRYPKFTAHLEHPREKTVETALGQIEFGIPCVVGGALGSAGLRLWDAQK